MCVCVYVNRASPYGSLSTGRRKREPEGRTLDISGSSLKEGLNLSPQLLQTRFRKPQQCLRAAPANGTEMTDKSEINSQKVNIDCNMLVITLRGERSI